MGPLSARQAVEIWEQGSALPAASRALLLLEAACPERAADELAALSIGERDAWLLELHAMTFGPCVAGFSECAHCGESLEFEFATRELLIHPRSRQPRSWESTVGEYSVRYRLPNSTDLVAASQSPDAAQGRLLLLERCVEELQRNGKPVEPADLPQDFAEKLSAQMSACDPQADVQIAIRCPACGVESEQVLDIASFLWTEVSALAKRLLRQVDVLACAYGWSEAQILSLGPVRRQFYLGMVAS